MDWMTFWKLVLLAMLGLFAVMAIVGTILGARDIRRLMGHLRNPDREESPDAGVPDEREEGNERE